MIVLPLKYILRASDISPYVPLDCLKLQTPVNTKKSVLN